jgi:hypothetical protein
MIESILQTFLLLATFDTILISVSIALYAISASYLGRETRLTRWRMEKRQQKLSERIKELQAKGLSIEDLRKEMDEAETDITVLKRRTFLLSYLGAVILPSIFFIISLISAVVGMNMELLQTNLQLQNLSEQQAMIISVGFLGVGFLVLMVVISAIDATAKRIPIPEFEVYYENETKTIECKRNTKISFRIWIRNKGEDAADDVDIYLNFPPSFKPEASPIDYTLKKQSRVKGIDFPDYTAVFLRFDTIHIETLVTSTIHLVTPDEPKTYEIPVYIYERKTGLTKDKLTIKVTD